MRENPNLTSDEYKLDLDILKIKNKNTEQEINPEQTQPGLKSEPLLYDPEELEEGDNKKKDNQQSSP